MPPPFSFKKLAIASALLLGHAATFAQDTSVPYTLDQSDLASRGPHAVQLAASNQLLAALNSVGAKLENRDSYLQIRHGLTNEYIGLSADVPLTALSGTVSTETGLFSPSEIATSGGFRLLTASHDPLIERDGSLLIDNLRIDLDTQRVYADLSGANGVGERLGQLLWSYGSIQSGPLQPFDCPMDSGPCGLLPNITIGSLTMNSEAFDLVTQSLGLDEHGIAVFQTITDYGTLASPVPEASTWAQLALGLAGLGCVAARRRLARR